MPQVLKHEIESALLSAAVRVFASRGYSAATMSEIAALAGVSTGNVYRYFESKERLFLEAVPGSFVRRFRSLLRSRVEALHGVADVRELPPAALYHLASEELLRFCIDHRLRVVILLARSDGSGYAGFGERTVRDLVRFALEYLATVAPGFEPARLSKAHRFALTEIYRSFVRIVVGILESFEDEAGIRAAVDAYTRYHLAGLRSFFEAVVAEQAPGSVASRRRER